MTGFALHPNVYATGDEIGLLRMLENVWIRDSRPGAGTLFIVSGFGNYNGGVRFFNYFRDHISAGGQIVGFFGGSTAQRLTSRQLIRELLDIRAEVNIVNRKRILHAKMYGASTAAGERLIVSSGNFTGPGMSLNVESSISLDPDVTRAMGFQWTHVIEGLRRQEWDVYRPDLAVMDSPAWRLLYDEFERELVLDESEESTLLITLSHADTARIEASPGDIAGKGTQYFWLSRDCYGFFPPLTVINQRGVKRTFSCLIRIRYVDLGGQIEESRVTFEAENNLDFRLGTAPLRYSRLVHEGDLAALSRVGEAEYELRLFGRDSRQYQALIPYATTFIGHRGKRYGYVQNAILERLLGIQLARASGIRPAAVIGGRPTRFDDEA
jgi:hypothetical protein